MFASNNAYGVNSPFALMGVLVVTLSAPLLFAVSYLYRKRQGLDLMLVFKQLPPE